MPKGYKHGLRYTPEYRVWINMRARCVYPDDYNHYYYKDISICLEWDDPVVFVSDMGKRPSNKHQLDRIDNTKGYFKENCRWVLRTVQMRNTRIAKRWFVYGVQYESLSEAATYWCTTPTRIKAWCEGRSDGGYTYPPKFNCWSEKVYA